jgi:hypothetical protein
LAGAEDPEEAIIAVALSVFEVSMEAAVLVVTALTVDHGETGITNAALSLDIEVAVEGAEIRGYALALVEISTVVAATLTVDVSLVRGADRVAETID